MTTLILFLVVLSILVLAHEMGHFIVARLAKVRIEEFAIGFPPRLVSIRHGETDYSINLLPLGGYVRMTGEEDPSKPGSLAAKPPAWRAAVLCAGVAMNVALAMILFTLIYLTGVSIPVPTGEIRFIGIASGSPAEQAGLKPGDVVVSVDGQGVTQMDAFRSYINAHTGQPVTVVVRRDGIVQPPVTLEPRQTPPPGQGALGVVLDYVRMYEKRTYALPQAVALGVQSTWNAIAFTVYIPVQVIRGLIPVEVARPVGPVGVGRIIGSAAEQIPTLGWEPLLQTMALLSVSLAVVNILPLPGLDGGRLIFVLLEWVRRGKRISPEREAIIHLMGLAFLMGLIVLISYYDIVSPPPDINWRP